MDERNNSNFLDREIQGTVVELPSLGLLYDGQIPDGKVTVSAMTTREERALASGGSNAGLSITDLLISRCVFGLGDLKPADLLIGDRAYLIMAIRAVSFGQDYQFQTNCESCRTPFLHTVKVPDGLEIIYLKQGFTEPFEVTLPRSGIKLKLRLLRGTDELELTKLSKTIFKHLDASVEGDPLYSHRIVKHIVSMTLPPKKGFVPPPEDALVKPPPGLQEDGSTVIENNSRQAMDQIIRIYDTLTSADSQAIRDALSANDCGINTDVEFSCPSCKETFTAMLPVKVEFFRPGGNKGVRYL